MLPTIQGKGVGEERKRKDRKGEGEREREGRDQEGEIFTYLALFMIFIPSFACPKNDKNHNQ